MNSIIPQNNDFDLFAKLIVMDQSIRRKELDGTVYFAVIDVLEKLSDPDRQSNVRFFWRDLKKSPRMRNMLLNLSQIHFGGRGRPVEAGDYAAILYIAMSMPDDRANRIRAYIADRMAKMSEPALKYLLRQQSEGKALAAEEIRHLHQIGYLPTLDDDDAFTDIGYKK